MVDHSRNNGVDIGSILTTSRIIMSFWTYKFFAAHRAPARGAPFFLCAKRQKGSLERQASGPLHHSSGGGRLAVQTNDTATAPA